MELALYFGETSVHERHGEFTKERRGPELRILASIPLDRRELPQRRCVLGVQADLEFIFLDVPSHVVYAPGFVLSPWRVRTPALRPQYGAKSVLVKRAIRVPPKPTAKAHAIGLRIKEIRAYLGRPRRPWSQGELARQLEMDVRTLRRREADGDLNPDLATRLTALAHCDLAWLLTGQGSPPGQATDTSPPPVSSRGAGPASRPSKRRVGSGSMMQVEEREASWRGFRVLASRIARTVQTTIAGNELGYSTASRAMLADSLELFAHELDRRSGEKVCGDIWEVVAWLRKPEGK